MPAITAIQVSNLLEAVRVLNREKVLAKIEKKLEKQMQVLFRKQGRLFRERLKKYQGQFTESLADADLADILDSVGNDSADEMHQIIHVANSTAYGWGIDAASDIGHVISFKVGHPEAMKWLDEHAAEMVTKIDETTRGYISGVVQQGVEEGWSYSRMAREISGRYEEFAVGMPQGHIESRAYLVAVTETGNAYEQGHRDSMDVLTSQGLNVEKSWNTMGDDLVTEECAANEDAGWIPIDEDFPSGDQQPLRFPGCRCNATYQVAGAGEGGSEVQGEVA